MTHIPLPTELKVPELPEGWFFRVTEQTLYTYYKVSLRRPYKFLGLFNTSTAVDTSYVSEGPDAKYVHEAMERIMRRQAELELERKIMPTLVGDYPPKEL